MTWSASQYVQFEDDRTRPVRDLVAAIPTPTAAALVDLGCGPGNSTEVLSARYPGAAVLGVDSSADMLDAARARMPGATFVEADVGTWSPSTPPDVILANAVLHWLPDHRILLPRLLGTLAPGGSLAIQMPENMAESSQLAMDRTAAEGPWAAAIQAGAGFRVPMLSAFDTIDLLRPLAARVDVWRTTYMHVLPGGPDAIVEWFKGSGLRPFLAPLAADQRAEFLARYRTKIAESYPLLGDGSVVLPFPRLFIVATR